MAAIPTFATIAASGTTSTAVDCAGLVVGIQCPAALTGTTITFTAAALAGSQTTYGALYNGNTLVSYTVAADRYISLDPSIFAGVRSFKIVSGSTEAASRTFCVVMRAE